MGMEYFVETSKAVKATGVPARKYGAALATSHLTEVNFL
jgi:hypothetical protein